MTNTFDDIAQQAQCLFIIGSNTTEQHPVFGMQLRQAVKQRGVPLIVADPRRMPITEYATIHLRHKPGTDTALLNGLMNVLIAEDLYDHDFVASRTEGFEELKAKVAEYTPGACGRDLRRAGRRHPAGGAPDGRTPARRADVRHGHHPAHQRPRQRDELRQPADAAGQHGRAGRRRQSAARPVERAGRLRHGRPAQLLPGYQNVALEASRKKFEAAWGAVPPVDKPGLTVVEMMTAAERGADQGDVRRRREPVLSDPDVNHVRHCLEALGLPGRPGHLPDRDGGAGRRGACPARRSPRRTARSPTASAACSWFARPLIPVGDDRPDWEIIAELGRRTLAMMSPEPPAAIAAAAAWVAGTTRARPRSSTRSLP